MVLIALICDYPPEAIREALLNAMVHRDYSFGGSTLVSIFDGQIEFVTIGGIEKGLKVNDILIGISQLRNQHPADVFYRLQLIETYGMGMPKILHSYDDYVMKPQIEATDNAFKITLPNTNRISDLYQTGNIAPLKLRETQILSYSKTMNLWFVVMWKQRRIYHRPQQSCYCVR